MTELFQEDIAQFRVLLAQETVEDPFEQLAAGDIPRLQALQLHNSTVYRWNRPCYGISEGETPSAHRMPRVALGPDRTGRGRERGFLDRRGPWLAK